MNKLYLIEEGNEAAKSLAEKLAAYTGDGYLELIGDELIAFADGKILEYEEPGDTPIGIIEIDPNKNYMAVIDRHKLRPNMIRDIHMQFHNVKVVLV